MKTYFVGVVSILTFSANAFAFAPTPLLVFTYNRGSVAREYSEVRYCKIFGDGTVVQTETKTTQVAYTVKVPDAQAIQDLLVVASRGKIDEEIGRIGGPDRVYQGFITQLGDRAVPVMLYSSGTRHLENKSGATRRLLQFMDYNCNVQ